MKKLILISLCWAAASLCGIHAQAQVMVIANDGTKAVDVSRSDLRDLFTGSSSSLKDGSHATVVILRPGPASDEFLSLYVGKSDAAFRAGWRSLLFSGQGVMPKIMESEAAMVEYVARTPGAIGYIAKATPHDGVKTLTVR